MERSTSISTFDFLHDHVWSWVTTNFKMWGNLVGQSACGYLIWICRTSNWLCWLQLNYAITVTNTVSSLRQARGFQVFLVLHNFLFKSHFSKFGFMTPPLVTTFTLWPATPPLIFAVFSLKCMMMPDVGIQLSWCHLSDHIVTKLWGSFFQSVYVYHVVFTL